MEITDMTTNQTHAQRNGSGIIGVFIGLALLFFGLLLALFILRVLLKIVFALAPLAGLAIAAYGGYQYMRADVQDEKLDAMKIVAVGLGVAVLGLIF
jgi:hypothetical protein